MGKFTKVIDKGWDKILLLLKRSDGAHVNVGVLSDESTWKKPKKHLTSTEDANLASIAAFNEFGSRSIPPRPFMKQSFDKNRTQVNNFIADQYSEVLAGKKTIDGALKLVGVFFEGKVKETIANGNFAANDPKTIRKKGSSKPLIDTGRLRQSISHEVKS